MNYMFIYKFNLAVQRLTVEHTVGSHFNAVAIKEVVIDTIVCPPIPNKPPCWSDLTLGRVGGKGKVTPGGGEKGDNGGGQWRGGDCDFRHEHHQVASLMPHKQIRAG